MEEINLRDLIEVILRGKRLIAGTTLLAMLVSGVFSFFVLSPTYEATAVVLVNNPIPAPRPVAEPGLEQLLNRLSSTPAMTMEAYRSQVTNPVVLQKVSDSLGLRLGAQGLADRIQARSIKDTGLIQITVQDADPQQAAVIANRIVQEYVTFISLVTKEQIQKSGQFISTSLSQQEVVLASALDELKGYLQAGPGAGDLQREIDAKVTLLADLKAERARLVVDVKQAAAGMERASQNYEREPQVLVTTKSITDDSYLQSLAEAISKEDAAALSGLSMRSEEVNPAKPELAVALSEKRVNYEELVARRAALDSALADIEQSLEQLHGLQVERQIGQDKLQHRVDVVKNAYDAMAQKYEEARINATVQFAETTLTIASRAAASEVPVGPHKALNVALAGVLGLMASVFLVFFLEFWRTSAPTARSNSAMKAGMN